ncbi:MAG: hypothetical protein ACLTSX_02725 [Collinsella sp.]
MAGLAFILNVVLDGEHHVIGAFAGDIHAAHEAGCDFVRGLAGVSAVDCDVAITTNGGYPLDQNIYQAVKGMTAAEATLDEGGVIIAVAGCADGHGGEGFFKNIAENDPAAFERFPHRPSQGPDAARPVDRPNLRAHPRPSSASSS